MARTINSTTSTGITLSSVSDNPVTVTGTITAGSGYGLYGQYGGGSNSWTVTNSGTITSGVNHAVAFGYSGKPVASATFTNSGYVSGTGNTVAYGIAIFGPGTVINNAGGTIKGQVGAVGIGDFGTIINSGVLIGGTIGLPGAGAYIIGGAIINSAGASITGRAGVKLQAGAAATVTNFGTISGLTTGASGGAVRFLGNDAANRLIEQPSGVILAGGLYGGGGVLELASAASAATLSPSHITNFATIQFDSANWRLGVKSSEVGSSTITGFVHGDTIDVTDFLAVSQTFTGGALVLTNSGNQHATLHFGGSVTAATLQTSKDAGSGTYITLQPTPQNITLVGTGTLDWNNASIWNPAVVPGYLDSVAITNAGSNLVTTSAAGTIDFDSLLIGGNNTLLVAGAVSGNTITDNAVLAFAGIETLNQTPLSLAGTLAVQGTGTLTLGAQQPISQSGTSAIIGGLSAGSGTIDNQGAINAKFAGGTLKINPLSFSNAGIISAANEALSIGFNDGKVGGVRGPWSNSGTIALSGTASLTLDGSLATGGIGTITGATGVTEAGLLDNTGATLHVGTGTQLGTVNLANAAVVTGGTIVNHGDGFTFNRNGTFNAVTFQGPLDLASNNALLNITGGLTVKDAAGTGPGTINLTNGGDAIINFVNSQSIDNVTFNLNGTDSFNPLTEIDIGGATNSVLTFGSNVVISSTAANTQADIRNTAGAQTSVVNKGTIVAAASHDAKHISSLGITPVQGFTNQGTILVSNDELLSIQPGFGIFSNSGIVSISGSSTLQISGSSISPSLNNTGTITLASGTTLDLAGLYTPASLGNLVNEGATTKIEGVLDAQAGTVTLGPGTLLNQVVLRGNMRNGTIMPSGSLTVESVNASFLNATIAGPLALTSDFTNLTLNEGVSFTDVTGKQPGTIDVSGQGNSLILQNLIASGSSGQTLDNLRINIGNAQTIDNIQPTFFGGTLTIGTGATIASSSAGALVNFHPGSSTTVDFKGTLLATGNAGVFTLSGTGGGFGSVFRNNGLIHVGNGDLFSLTAPIAGGTGTIEIGANGRADFAAAVAAGQTVAFADATGRILLNQPGSFAATVKGFTAGDTIDIPGTLGTTAVWSAGLLTISGTGGTIAELSLPDDYSTAMFSAASDGLGGTAVTVTATCYAAGTRILTPHGEVPIEGLREGDLVLTVSGRAQPIRWIGQRRVNFRRHPNRQRILPVRIAAHAFGPGLPKRALLLSPDHAVFVEDVLIPIRHLLNGSTIAQIERHAITYYHLELPRHDVVLAEGLPAESYLEAGARDAFANGGGVMQLHPEFEPPLDHYAMLWELHGYAPLVVAGEIVERVRQSVLQTEHATTRHARTATARRLGAAGGRSAAA